MQTRGRRIGARVALYGALLVIGVGTLQWLAPRPVRGDVEILLDRVQSKHGTQYREGLATLAFVPGAGYTLSAHVGADRVFAPGRILVVQRLRDQLQVELLIGDRHTSVLHGDQARAYLARTWLSLERLDELFQAHFAHPPAHGPLAARRPSASAGGRVAAVDSGARPTPVGK